MSIPTGTTGDDSITGGTGDDVISGLAGNDTLVGAAGDDSLIGGTGNDSLVGGDGNDFLDGGTGTADIAAFSGNFADYLITYDSTTGEYTVIDTVAARDGTDTVTGVESFVFLDLTIASNLVPLTIVGTSGNDAITGAGGADTLSGHEGNDTITGGDGNDSIQGDEGNDSLVGGAGDDMLTGGAGTDVIEGGTGTDTVVFTGNFAEYTVVFNSVTQQYFIRDTVADRDGLDVVKADVEKFKFADGVRNNVLLSVDVGSTFSGTTGNDSLTGTDHNDFLSGDKGNDTLVGGAGNDWLTGGDGSATDGADDLQGGAGNDFLEGGMGNDTLAGGAGNDTLCGGDGNGLLTGDGTDTAVFQGNYADYSASYDSATGWYTIVDGIAGRDGTDMVRSVESFEFHDTVRTSAQLLGSIVDGTDASDSLVGGIGNDSLNGGLGDDTLQGGGGNDVIAGGFGRDTASYAGTTGAVTVSLAVTGAQNTGGSGIDTLTGIENLIGGNGNDRLTGDFQDNTLAGGPGNDTLAGGGGHNVAVFTGNAANYTVTAANGSAVITDRVGSDGTDTLTQIDRLKFADEGLALDLNGNAGLVATTIGAVFGAASVHNVQYVGIGLQQLDQGTTYEALMQLALDARLGPDASHKAVVDLLYTNVIGVAPTPAQEAPFVALLDSGQYSPATLGILAAQQPQNLVGVNIESWSKAGLPFEWFG
jgi:Ca2+-binding RTX toxin-like protein